MQRFSLTGEKPVSKLQVTRALGAERALLCCTQIKLEDANKSAALLLNALVQAVQPPHLQT